MEFTCQERNTEAPHGCFCPMIQDKKNKTEKGLLPSSQIRGINWPTFPELGPMFCFCFCLSMSAYLETSTGVVERTLNCFKAFLGCGDKQSEYFRIVLAYVQGKTRTFILFLKKVNQLYYVGPFLDLKDTAPRLSC